MDNRPLAGRVRVPSRPLPAGTDHWYCVVDSPDFNPFLPRILWTTEGYQGTIHLDPDIDAMCKAHADRQRRLSIR